jgi:hypothetical protein
MSCKALVSRFDLGNFGVYAQLPSPDYKVTCEKIAHGLSPLSLKCFIRVSFERMASSVHCINLWLLGSQEYNYFDISHWANSSSQSSMCSVEPGTKDDVASVVNLVLLPELSRCPADVSTPIFPASSYCRRSCAVRSERWWTRCQPWFLVNPGCTHLDDPFTYP